MTLADTAPAKVNLTLRVLGRRPDGFHEIESLVAFAAPGDALSLSPGDGMSLRISGPFAGDLNGDNLVLKAAESVIEEWSGAKAGEFHLTKILPVAAGIGGGSADAAAALRLLAQANPGIVDQAAFPAIAQSLGADVPVCLESRAAIVRGIGERITPVSGFVRPAAVLVNPGAGLATRDVFAGLAAPPLDDVTTESESIVINSLESLISLIDSAGNDLEAPATRLLPDIGDVKAALAAADGCVIAGMSGSGATCFGLFESTRTAGAAAKEIALAHPGWWVQAATLQ